MVLDDPSLVSWRKRLERRSMDDCFLCIEKATLIFQRGNPIEEIYVGGILNEDIWYSYGLDEKGRLMPHIERLPVHLISDYRTIN